MTLSKQELRHLTRPMLAVTQPGLQHHGVLGMKWGKHKSQKAVTRSGNRQSTNIDKTNAQKEMSLAIQRKKEYHDRGALSDAELNRRVNRLQTEQRYKELVNQPFKDIKAAKTAKRNAHLKRVAAVLATVPFALINPAGAGSTAARYGLIAAKYGIPIVGAAVTGASVATGGGKKKKKK